MAKINTSCIFIGGKQLGFNCLKRLIERNVRPELILGNPDDNGEDSLLSRSLLKLAHEENLRVVREKKMSDPEITALFNKIRSEIIFSIGGVRLIPREVLKNPRLGCLNIHSSLLPKYSVTFVETLLN